MRMKIVRGRAFAYGYGRKRPADTKKKRHPAMRRVLLVFLVILTLTYGVLKFAELRLNPIISSMAITRGKSLATQVISEAIADDPTLAEITYDDLVSFEKDAAGKITALKTNVIEINKIKASLSVDILGKLSDIPSTELKIPIGNLINGELFSGRGPAFTVRLIPVGAVSADVNNVFTSAGINQTRHQIMLQIHATINLLLPTGTVSTDIDSSVCIAETVIVGDVPGAFTQVDGSTDGLANTIHDYGAAQGMT